MRNAALHECQRRCNKTTTSTSEWINTAQVLTLRPAERKSQAHSQTRSSVMVRSNLSGRNTNRTSWPWMFTPPASWRCAWWTGPSPSPRGISSRPTFWRGPGSSRLWLKRSSVATRPGRRVSGCTANSPPWAFAITRPAPPCPAESLTFTANARRPKRVRGHAAPSGHQPTLLHARDEAPNDCPPRPRPCRSSSNIRASRRNPVLAPPAPSQAAEQEAQSEPPPQRQARPAAPH